MSARVQAIILWIVYSSAIAGTLWLSGRVAGKSTLYDEYLVALDGNVLEVRDFEAARRFYADVLDFRFAESEGLQRTLILPGDRRIFLYQSHFKPASLLVGRTEQARNFIVLRVRNGIKQLQREIAARSGAAPVAISQDNVADGIAILPAGRVSEILTGESGMEFVVKDPDGNQLVFFQPFPFEGAKYRPLVATERVK